MNGSMGAAGGQVESERAAEVPVSTLEMRTLSPETFLYTEVARSHLGERAGRVIELLLNKGRLSVSELVHLAPELGSKSVRTVLVSLIQLRCVQYLEETTASGRKITYYYFNEEGFQLMLYAGDIVAAVEGQFEADDAKEMAAQIVQNVLALGSLTTKDYIQSLASDISMNDVASMFVKLVELGFLVPLSNVHYMPLVDLWDVLYKKEYNAIPKNSTLSDAKKRAETKAKTKVQFNSLLKNVEMSNVLTTDMQTSLRRVQDNIPLTFNFGRYMKHRRSRQLVQFARSRVGSVPAMIYKVALRITEQCARALSDPLCETGLMQELEEQLAIQEDMALDDEKLPGVTFNAVDISRNLPSDIDLRGTLTSTQRSNKRNTQQAQSHKRLKTDTGLAVPVNQLATVEEEGEEEELLHGSDDDMDMFFDEGDNDPRSVSLINGHLKLLSTGSVPFLIESRPGLFYVPYSKLIPILKEAVYDAIIASTLGPSAHRILRCVRDNSLVSEKVINNTALMKEKDIRSVIATLVKYNAVDILEVPRTADRAASRAVFLFKINEKHAYDFMKQNLAWNIANSIHKTEILKEENSTLLSKAQRDDVKGKEAELLLPSELNQLKMVNERELNGHARKIRLLSMWEVFKML
ncbi:AaceriAEL282Wp [[Ashbya] aceris (nom. inval.)]|nr:AaceriAEL282Wp [[Ashbya] aceris (nom. inval.)]